MFTTDWELEASSEYAQPSVIRCDELSRYQSINGFRSPFSAVLSAMAMLVRRDKPA